MSIFKTAAPQKALPDGSSVGGRMDWDKPGGHRDPAKNVENLPPQPLSKQPGKGGKK